MPKPPLPAPVARTPAPATATPPENLWSSYTPESVGSGYTSASAAEVNPATTAKSKPAVKLVPAQAAKAGAPKGPVRTSEAEVRARLVATYGDPSRIPKADKKRIRDAARKAVFKDHLAAENPSPAEEPAPAADKEAEVEEPSSRPSPASLPVEDWDEVEEEDYDEEDFREQEAEFRRREEEANVDDPRRGGDSGSSRVAPRSPSPDRRRSRADAETEWGDQGRYGDPPIESRGWEFSMLESQRENLTQQLFIAQEARNRTDSVAICAMLNEVNRKLSAYSDPPAGSRSQPTGGKGKSSYSSSKGTSKGYPPGGSGQDKRRRT